MVAWPIVFFIAVFASATDNVLVSGRHQWALTAAVADHSGAPLRIGLDLGAARIAGVVLDREGTARAGRERVSTFGDPAALAATVAGLVTDLEQDVKAVRYRSARP